MDYNPYEVSRLIFEGQGEYFDFKDSFLAQEYLKSKEEQMSKVPKYIPEEVIGVWKQLWKMIQTHRKTLKVALMTLYNSQTHDEQEDMCTLYRNLSGFNKSEAQYLSKMIEISKERPLSLNEIATCIPALRKYTVQLLLNQEFMEDVGMDYEFRTIVLRYADEIQEIRKRG